MLVEICRIFNLRCGVVQRELSCIWMRCGAACGQGLRTQRSMRMHILLSALSLVGTANKIGSLTTASFLGSWQLSIGS